MEQEYEELNTRYHEILENEKTLRNQVTLKDREVTSLTNDLNISKYNGDVDLLSKDFNNKIEILYRDNFKLSCMAKKLK